LQHHSPGTLYHVLVVNGRKKTYNICNQKREGICSVGVRENGFLKRFMKQEAIATALITYSALV
jgi:hypothetical protein